MVCDSKLRLGFDLVDSLLYTFVRIDPFIRLNKLVRDRQRDIIEIKTFLTIISWTPQRFSKIFGTRIDRFSGTIFETSKPNSDACVVNLLEDFIRGQGGGGRGDVVINRPRGVILKDAFFIRTWEKKVAQYI